jgi:hypothetical protein
MHSAIFFIIILFVTGVLSCSHFHHEDTCLNIDGCAWCPTTGQCVAWNPCKRKPWNHQISPECAGGWKFTTDNACSAFGSGASTIIIVCSIFGLLLAIGAAATLYYGYNAARRRLMYAEIK